MMRLYSGVIMCALSVVVCASALAGDCNYKILAPPESQGPAYTIAAEQLQKYWLQVTGQQLEIVRTAETSSAAGDQYLIIGSDAVNPFVRQLVERKVIADFPLKTSSDDFRLLTVKDGDRTHLILAGGRGRSTLYAVYWLFENRAGCRWFWDGDLVPKQESIDITNLDVSESPRFQYRGQRYFAHRGLHRFQAEHWSLDDWKAEIDWLVKKRLNIFMLRIGVDDIYQKAFPEIVDYPDPTRPIPEALSGYNNRSLFWSLQFRGQLRKQVLQYAFDRDLMHPEDFGTMTHWYSRTPQQFLDKVNPSLLPQSTSDYAEKTGLVWDIRDDENLENYWKMTQAHIDNYGKPELFHTIGIAERRCYADREDNLRMKLYAYRRLIDNLRKHYPNAPLLLAGWDFYGWWTPDEIKEFLSQMDPERTILWDYEAEVRGNNFTQWGVVGKFPYVFGIFQAYESAMDIRGNYPMIEQRMKSILDDPYCKGYILWPENSHSDIFMLHYFTSNSWRPGQKSTDELLNEFCRDRYGSQAAAMETIWQDVLPISQMLDWWGNFWLQMNNTVKGNRKPQDSQVWHSAANDQRPKLVSSEEIFTRLAEIQWSDPFVRRDSIDLARTTMDRLITCARVSMFDAMNEWRQGRVTTDQARRKVEAFHQLGYVFRDLLALHEDYSIAETVEKLNQVEPIVNPDFDRVILDNASCSYCQSHQYELVNTWYLPCFDVIASWANDRLDRDDRSEFSYPQSFKQVSDAAWTKMLNTPLDQQKPTVERTEANFRDVMTRAATVAKDVVEPPQP